MDQRRLYDQRPDLIYTGQHAVRRAAPQRDRSWTTIISARSSRASRLSCSELDEELWKLGVSGKDRAQRGRPRAARAGPDLHHGQHRRRPQPADDGDDAARWPTGTALCACCTKSRLPGVNGSGQAQQLVDCHRHAAKICSNPGDTPEENAQFLLVPVRGHPGGGRICRTCCASSVALGRQRPPSRRQRSAACRSFRCSSATS